MDPDAYLEMADTEARHWWFAGRRAVLASLISKINLPSKARILEVGCGTGGNLQMLSAFGSVSALEMNEKARSIASKKTGGRFDIRAGCCPMNIPFSEEKFDLICLIDVLEHIKEDVETLIAVKRLLAKKGRIVLTVPAYSWLWSVHDEFLHHKRRYSAKALWAKALAAGLQLERMSYFNTLLFPLAAAVRIKDRMLGSSSASGTRIPSPFFNVLFYQVFSAERFLLSKLNLPFGVSLLAILYSD